MRALLTAACWLLLAGLATAQTGNIIVTSPTSDSEVYVGGQLTVEFYIEGDATGPYQMYLAGDGDNEEIDLGCGLEGCEADEDLSITVTLASTFDEGVYSVVVMDIASLVRGSSEAFDLQPAPDSSAAGEGQAEAQNVGGGGEVVGDMNLAMLIVACICGVVLIGTIIAACLILSRRRAKNTTKSVGSLMIVDVETGNINRSYTGNSRGKSPSPNEHSLKSTRSLGSSRPYSDSDDKYRSPARALARGSTQRVLSLSKSRDGDGSRSDDDQGPRMYSSTPARDRDGRGSATMSNSTPGLNSDSDTNGGPRMYSRSRSNTPGNRSKGWDELGQRMFSSNPGSMGRDRHTRRGREGHVSRGHSSRAGLRREAEEGRRRGVSRHDSRSASRERPPRSGTHEYGSNGGRMKRGTSSRSPYRAQGANSPVDGYTRHASGYRRSRSLESDVTASQSERQEWGLDAHKRGNEGGAIVAGGSPLQSRDHALRETGRRSRSADVSERDGDVHGDSNRYDREKGYRRSRSEDKNEGEPTSPTRHSPTHRSGTGEPHILHDISWEELRSTYQTSKTSRLDEGNAEPVRRLAHSADPPRVRKNSSLPSYGEVTGVGSAKRLHTSEADNRGAPPSYTVLAKFDHLAIGIPAELHPESLGRKVGAGALSARQPRAAAPAAGTRWPISRSNSTRGYSPGSRAVSARAAAREAQLSAERALAAAAAASRAADMAAQAAIEAEAEADAELCSVAEVGVEEDTSETPNARTRVKRTPSSRSSRSSTRTKSKRAGGSAGSIDSSGGGPSGIGVGHKAGQKPHTPGRSQGWSEAEEQLVKARASASAVKAKEALAVLTPRGVRPDTSWLASEVRGADSAGGGRGAQGGGGNALLPPRLRSSMTPGEERAHRQRAFVKQYSEASTFDGESEYSLHDDRSATSMGGGRPLYMSQDSGLTSFDDSDFSCADESPLYKSGGSASQASPRGDHDNPHGKAGVDRIGIKVKKRNTDSRSPEPASVRKKTIHETLSPKHISEAGSS